MATPKEKLYLFTPEELIELKLATKVEGKSSLPARDGACSSDASAAMPRLLLLRHATAERARPGEADHERALTKGGRKEAKAIGKIIAERGEAIDLVLSSDSRRTRETWDGVAAELDGEARGALPALALRGGTTICRSSRRKAARRSVDPPHRAQSGDARDRDCDSPRTLPGATAASSGSGFPKAAVAIFDFDGEWMSLQPGRMRLVAFIEADESS